MWARLVWFAALGVMLSSRVSAEEYDLVLDEKTLVAGGDSFEALAINDQVPGPTLRFTEGEVASVNVTNNLNEPASLHWHGLLVPAHMDGVPGLNGFTAIPPGGTFTYRFRVKQSGTYWYHSHSMGQEQMGLYGPIVIVPKERDPIKADRDYVVLLSDATHETPEHILRNLKVDSGFYNHSKRTISDFFADTREHGLTETIDDRLAWGEMRMDPTDISDVTNYTFLVNGRAPGDNWTGLFKPGERVRLRIIDGSAMTLFDVRIPGMELIVVAADGQSVTPVPVDEFRIAPGETYDVVVVPKEEGPYTIFAESIDRTGYARGTLALRNGLSGQIPAMRPRTVLTMDDMGMAHGSDTAAQPSSGTPEQGGMDHHMMMGDPSHNSAMHHPTGERMSGETADPAQINSAKPKGWAAGAPSNSRVLQYSDLKSSAASEIPAAPIREIIMRLGGSMERYAWTIDGRQHHDAEPVKVKHGDRLRIVFVNETMMPHPMHLHGMFFELDNGFGDRNPKKHTVIVPPGQSVAVLVTAGAFGKWALHCHLLYHMLTGMMTELTVLDADGEAPPWY